MTTPAFASNFQRSITDRNNATAFNNRMSRPGQPIGNFDVGSVIRGNKEMQADSPVYRDGRWVSKASGQPWHGAYTGPNGQQTYFSNGQMVSNSSMVGQLSDKPQFDVTRTPKNPEISGQVDTLSQANQKNNSIISGSFNRYLNEANDLNAGLRTDLGKSLSSINPEGTISRINSGVSGLTDSLRGANNRYSTELGRAVSDSESATGRYLGKNAANLAALQQDTTASKDELNKNLSEYKGSQDQTRRDIAGSTGRYVQGERDRLDTLLEASKKTEAGVRGSNSDYEAQQRALQQKLVDQNTGYESTQRTGINDYRTALDNRLSDYEKAAQAVADKAYGQALKRTSLYQLQSGTPTSGSGNLSNRYIREYANINVPLQRELADRRLAEEQQMYGLNSGLTREDYQNRANQIASEMGLNSDVANRNLSVEQYLNELYGRNYNAGEAAGRNIYAAEGAQFQNEQALASDFANRRAANQQYFDQLSGRNYSAADAAARGDFSAESALNNFRASAADSMANRTATTEQAIQQADAGAAQYIQQLRQQVAGMAPQLVAQYLSNLRVPIEIAQQVMAAQIQNQAGIQALDERANAYTFSTPYDASRVPVTQSYPVALPSRRYSIGDNAAQAPQRLDLSNIGDVAMSQVGRYTQPQAAAPAAQPKLAGPDVANLVDRGDNIYTDKTTGYAWRKNTDSTGRINWSLVSMPRSVSKPQAGNFSYTATNPDGSTEGGGRYNLAEWE